ncbi:MAG TPA: FIST N-terminal domain-containing protein [Polyangiaceae bacterium]|nr:FIST N-terminal domain-containing protein [Polyangiaceae bacterium]
MRQAHTAEPDVERAIAELSAGLDTRGASANLLFCSPNYDLEKLGRKIAATFSGPVISCTTAGQIGQDGFQKGGITAVSLTSSELRVSPYLISPLAECQAQASEAAFSAMSGMLERGSERAFGLVLVDGMSRAEERLAACLYQSLGAIPLVGGSAGDDLAFKGTYVYHQGRFLRDAALFALFETTLPFTTFRVQHVIPGRHKLVVTMADPEQRVVHEFNGEPAAEAYAETLGVEVDELDWLLFSKNPLMLLVGGEHYVRSVQRVNADHSLAFFCALEEGLVLTVGESGDPLAALQRGFDGVREKIGTPEIALGCDCVQRRLEFEQAGTDRAVGELMSKNRVVGFSTYGEQYNAIYVNQTFSAVALSAE